MCGIKGCKKKIGATATSGSNGPLCTQSAASLHVTGLWDPGVTYKGVNNEWRCRLISSGDYCLG